MKFKLFSLGLAALFMGCSPRSFKQHWLQEQAPEKFKARFETNKGFFEIESYRKWSPKAVDRLYQLIRHGYFRDIPVYRVEQDFVVQFGTLDSTGMAAHWNDFKLPDEPVVQSNLNGTLSFGRGGKQTRANELFINMKDNLRLDTINFMGVRGFPVIAIVTKGMEVARRFYSYGLGVPEMPDSVKANPMPYFRKRYPKIDYIIKARVIN